MIEFEKILQELAQKMAALSAIAGTGCIWKVSPYLVREPDLPGECCRHDGEFCRAVKAMPGGELLCVCHDTREVAARIRQRPEAFALTCHAGAAEVIVPFEISPGECAGALMIGPFRLESGRCRHAETRGQFDSLPVLKPEALEGFREFVPQIFGDVIHRAYAEFAGLLARHPEDKRIWEVLEFLGRSYRENPTAAQAARRVFMSPSRLLHLFKLECGIGMGEYLHKLRLRKARRFLLAGAWPIGQVAEMSGFSDQSHFTLMFRREFGMPPLQYRKRFGKGGHSA